MSVYAESKWDVPHVLLKMAKAVHFKAVKIPSTREGTGQRVRIKSGPIMAIIRVRFVRRIIFCWPSPRNNF
jgi:hypothetical protein